MISLDALAAADKTTLQSMAERLSAEELDALVPVLSDTDDKRRYACFLVLQHKSRIADDLYRYWALFEEKLGSPNSYQRSLGLMLLAANTKWDIDEKFEALFDSYCALLDDGKPITVRQCIQSFAEIIPYKPALWDAIAARLMAVDIGSAKETMRKLLLTDILTILILIRKEKASDVIDAYLSDALTGGILDNKAKKAFQALL